MDRHLGEAAVPDGCVRWLCSYIMSVEQQYGVRWFCSYMVSVGSAANRYHLKCLMLFFKFRPLNHSYMTYLLMTFEFLLDIQNTVYLLISKLLVP